MLDGMRIRIGAYAVLGNHDTLALAEAVEEVGLRVLFNEGVAVGVPGALLWLAGVDDPHFYRMDDLDAALRDAPPEAFRVLLAHTPECAAEAANKGVGLYLCGHTHGGQVRLPGLGPIMINARCPRRRALGHWQAGAMRGFTSAGLGTTDAPVRFGCPPEAVLFTLRSGAPLPCREAVGRPELLPVSLEAAAPAHPSDLVEGAGTGGVVGTV
jgi:predicted MPP superfamily phosphohydrolase